MFKFSLQIDDKDHSLNSEHGISMDKISQLLSSLYKAIDADLNEICTLSGIRGNCYALDFSTETKSHSDRFNVVHKNLEFVPLEDLDDNQRAYGKVLKSILGDKYYINAYDQDKNKIASISGIDSGISSDYYYSQETIYGIVSQLGSKSLSGNKKHIYVDGIEYRIAVSKEKDILLKDFYGTDKLRIKIRAKRSAINGKIVSADLIEFQSLSKLNLSDSIESAGYVELEILKNCTSIDQLIDRIHAGDY